MSKLKKYGFPITPLVFPSLPDVYKRQTHGGWFVSNDQIKQLVDFAPDRFIGFASVDPRRPDALEVLVHAFKNQKLAGLKLNPSKQAFYPDDPMMDPIYKKCLEYNKPIMFHSGMSWDPDCLIKYAEPINFEEVAVKYPELRICLAHFGWPWAVETLTLIHISIRLMTAPALFTVKKGFSPWRYFPLFGTRTIPVCFWPAL